MERRARSKSGLHGRRGRRVLRLAAPVLAAAAVASCEAPGGSRLGNAPPETYLAVTGADLDTTHYEVGLHWWGSDADGAVDRYRFRWVGFWVPDDADTLWPADTTWVETRRTERTFLLPVHGTEASYSFAIQAVDDEETADPSPITQDFHVRNTLPHVAFGSDLDRPARSLPAVTFSIWATDAEGNGTIVGYRSWFEGEDPAASARFYPAGDSVRITIAPDAFPGPGVQTIHFQAIDESGTASADTASHTWEVIDVSGRRALVVDHYPNGITFPGAAEVDRFYREAVEARVGPSAVAVLNIQADGAFRTREETALAFSPFEAVVWYTGLQIPSNPADAEARIAQLRLARDGLVSYVENGGRAHLESTFAFGDAFATGGTAVWDSAAAYDLLGLTELRRNPQRNTNFTLSQFDHEILGDPAWGIETGNPLRPTGALNLVELFPLPAGAAPILWVGPGSVDIGYDVDGNLIQNDVDYYCGFRLPRGGGGLTFFSFCLARADTNANARAVIDAVLARLLP
jgi:hypothetical protein